MFLLAIMGESSLPRPTVLRIYSKKAMSLSCPLTLVALSLLSWICMGASLASAQEPESLPLWQAEVPHATAAKAPHELTLKFQPDDWRITAVTDPTLEVYSPAPELHNGKALLICPGGGYVHLHHTGEGAEAAKFFCGQGYTCFVLHYQVPRNRKGALADACEAMKRIRAQSARWNLAPDQIGALGFSAGGHLTARLVTHQSAAVRPDFALLIYAAYLDARRTEGLAPELSHLTESCPLFMFCAEDDQISIKGNHCLAAALKEADRPYSFHTVAQGGHGFWLKPGNPAAEVWPALAVRWLATL